jgi:NAD(P)-dependent dehydrogenase (short-subunit alcohol dehydrogenase family)
MTIHLKTPSLRLDGKRAVVSGASKGLGLAAAAALVQAGAEVTLIARTEADLTVVANDLRQSTPSAQVNQIVLDVTDSKAVDRFFSSAAPFSVLVNNAGTNRPKLLSQTTDADIDAIIDLNVKAAIYVARAAARRMQQGRAAGIFKTASIINISSQMGHVGAAQRTIYCASKHALEGFTKALAWELGPDQIRVNTLCPTFIETPLTAPMLAVPEFRDMVLSKIALNRLGSLEDMMGPIVFLASDASALMTGSALMLDGGWVAS